MPKSLKNVITLVKIHFMCGKRRRNTADLWKYFCIFNAKETVFISSSSFFFGCVPKHTMWENELMVFTSQSISQIDFVYPRTLSANSHPLDGREIAGDFWVKSHQSFLIFPLAPQWRSSHVPNRMMMNLMKKKSPSLIMGITPH